MRSGSTNTVRNVEFSELLITVCSEMGLEQRELAALIDYSPTSISLTKGGQRPASKSLVLLLETLLENHRLKQEVARVRGAAAELMGAAMPYERHTEAPATLNGNASSGARESRKQTPDEIFAAAKQKVLSQIPQAAVPSVPKPKPAREKTPPASSAPPARGAQP